MSNYVIMYIETEKDILASVPFGMSPDKSLSAFCSFIKFAKRANGHSHEWPFLLKNTRQHYSFMIHLW